MSTQTADAPTVGFSISPEHRAQIDHINASHEDLRRQRSDLEKEIISSNLQAAFDALVAEWRANGPTPKLVNLARNLTRLVEDPQAAFSKALFP